MKEFWNKLINNENLMDSFIGIGAGLLIFLGNRINSHLDDKRLDAKITEKVTDGIAAYLEGASSNEDKGGN